MQITLMRPIAVRAKRDQPDGYEVDIQVEWHVSEAGLGADSVLYSVVSVPLSAAPGTTSDCIANEGLRLFREALASTAPPLHGGLSLALSNGELPREDQYRLL